MSDRTAPDLRPASRLSMVDAVLLGVLAVSASLPFLAADTEPLWTSSPTSGAAATKLAVVVLGLMLLAGALDRGDDGLLAGVQVLVGALTTLAAVTTDGLGTGGTLLVTTAAIATVAGVATLVLARRAPG